jgi:hypothetical protein
MNFRKICALAYELEELPPELDLFEQGAFLAMRSLYHEYKTHLVTKEVAEVETGKVQKEFEQLQIEMQEAVDLARIYTNNREIVAQEIDWLTEQMISQTVPDREMLNRALCAVAMLTINKESFLSEKRTVWDKFIGSLKESKEPEAAGGGDAS